MAYVKTTVLTGDIVTATWGNAIQTQYEEALVDAAAAVPIVPLDRKVTTTTVTNTGVETTVYSKTILANTLGTDGMLRLKLFGRSINTSTVQNVIVRVKFGATTMATWTLIALNTTDPVELSATLSNLGATNSQKGVASFTKDAADSSIIPSRLASLAATEATTADKALVVTVQHPSAYTTLWTHIDGGLLELIKPT